MTKFSIDAQIAEVEREIKMREKVYPRQIGAGKAFRSKAEADMHLDIMKAALESLQWLKENRPAIVEWVSNKPAKKPEAV
jgi:hypothetical protein